MSRDLRKVHETSLEVRYAHPHTHGWIGALVGAVFIWLGWSFLEGGARWVPIGLGALFVWGGIGSALERLELTLDFAKRRFTYRRGQLGKLESGSGGFDEIDSVVLVKELQKKGSDRAFEWEVELVIRGWDRPLEVMETKDEAEARREAGELAAKIGVELTERTTT